MAENLTIGEVAEQAGVRTSAIRYYESIGLLPEPTRHGGQRRYEATILDQLAFIRVAQSLGFTIAEIQALFGPGADADDESLPTRWRSLAHRKLSEVDEIIRRAEAMRRLLYRGLRCHCPDRDECIDCVLKSCRETPIGSAQGS